MKGLNLRGVTEFCRVLVREPRLLLPQVSVRGESQYYAVRCVLILLLVVR